MFAFSAISFALAIAERMHFSILVAARFFVKRRMASACLTSLPRIISTTRRAFFAEPRKYFALAVASISQSFTWAVLPRPCSLFRPCSRVALERACWRKLTELVAHHVSRHVNRQMTFAVVHT